jgi:penicillin-binding protein 1A
MAAAALAVAIAAGLALWTTLGAATLRERLRTEVERALSDRLPRARLEGDVAIDARLRLVAGAIVVPALRPDAPPVLRVARVAVRPRFSALLRGRLELEAVSLEGVHVEPGPRLAELERLAAELGGGGRGGAPGGRAEPAGPIELTLSRVTAAIPRAGAAPLELGPFDGTLRASRDRAGGGALDLAWRARDGAGAVIEGTARIAPGARTAEIDLRARDVWLRSHRLAVEPVGPVALGLSGTLRWDERGRRAALERGRLALGSAGGAVFALEASLDARRELAFDASLRADALDWGDLADALPPALRPPADAPPLAGKLRVALVVSGPLRRPAAWRIDPELDASGLAPADGSSPALERPFQYTARWPGGRTRAVEVGPRNPSFVPLAALPRHLVRAVLTSEDAGFFGHHGFDLDEIREALATAGGRRRLRGASTITQQLAKNLYLSPERTLARKLREALATMALEASIPKRRLLEIYLNVAEWGDGVVGVGEAARHWFAKDARELTPKEAAFLASVIPNPVRYEMYRRRGALTDAWEARVRDLLLKLRAVDALSAEQLLDAWDAPLVFARG